MTKHRDPRQELAEHLALRPELPRPVPAVDDPAYQAWRRNQQAWVDRKALLEAMVAAQGMVDRDIVIPGPNGYVMKASSRGKKRGAA